MLFDKYLVVRRLGEGGMGQVWLVRHLDLDAERALKLIVSDVAFDAEVRARFRREARVMARFTHPNAVTVHDAIVRPDDNTAYIEMEYVRGRSLKELLRPGVPMPLDWTARIVAQLCDALQVAHENGIVHRDLKPSNLMLLDDQPPGREFLKVLDFGIAKTLGADHGDTGGLVTRADVLLGTPLYMSPEQVLADRNSLDARSDIYAVGMILYEFLTGHQAFTGGFHKLIYQHVNTPAPPLAARDESIRVPPEVERVVLRCLEKDPALRPQSARALAEEFLQAAAPAIQLQAADPAIQPLPRPAEETRRTRPWRSAVWATLALLVLGLAGGAAVWRFWALSFTVSAFPADLAMHAGDTSIISLVFRQNRPDGPVKIALERLPEGITATELASASSDGAQFQVVADLNKFPSTTSRTLTFRAVAGKRTKTATVGLRIEPPVLSLPPGCTPLPGATYERVRSRIYPSRIARSVAPRPPGDGETQVAFLLINKGRPGDPDPFYIMEHKVSNELFARFVQEHPESVVDNAYWQAIAMGKRSFSEAAGRLPAMNMTGKEAHAFADWLGGKLPRCEQWDKAAGAFDPDGRTGPFQGSWSPGDKTGVAVGRGPSEGPLPIGAAAQDISPFGCRDMAGNGAEWTRNTETPGKLIPLAAGDTANVILRGRTYRAIKPFLFKDLDSPGEGEAADYLEASDETGFRVVLEIEAF